ncbi:MAG: flippase [Patescibacteria group bacterium]|jgi:O-antigen/teichoic acid export membrane protein
MSLKARVAHNTIIQIAGKVISTVLGLFSIRVMADYLGPEGFGEYTTIITFLSFFAIIADLGLTLVTVSLISRKEADEEKILNNLFGLRFFSALVFLSAGPIIVFLFPYGSAIKAGVIVASLSFFFAALNQIFVGLFQKYLKMEKVSVAEVVGRVILLAGVIIAARAGAGLNGILLAAVVSAAANFFLLYIFSRRLARIRFGFDRGLWLEIIKKSWPLALTIFFNLLYLKTDTIILSLVRPLDEVGIYGAAYKVIDVLITIPFLFSGIILPILALAWSERDREKFGRVLQKSFNLLAILACPMTAGTFLISKRVMGLVAGPEFTPAGEALNILILASAAVFLGNIFAHAVIAVDRQKSIIPAYIFTAASSIIGYLIFIPRYSYFGAAWVTVYSETAIALFSFYIVYKTARFFPSLKVFFKSALAAAIMYSLSLPFRDFNIFLLMPSAAVIYLFTLYLLKGIGKEDLSLLKLTKLS